MPNKAVVIRGLCSLFEKNHQRQGRFLSSTVTQTITASTGISLRQAPACVGSKVFLCFIVDGGFLYFTNNKKDKHFIRFS